MNNGANHLGMHLCIKMWCQQYEMNATLIDLQVYTCMPWLQFNRVKTTWCTP